MKKFVFLQIALIFCGYYSAAQKSFTFSPLIQQTGIYYSAGHVTSDGYGFGLGLHVIHKSQVAGQVDVSLLWLNGNSVPVRLAIGYQRKGTWTPAVYGTVNMVFGQRTQLLTESGDKPPVPAWAFGIRVTPLKFKTKTGYVSALEIGCGFGPDKALSLEFSILSAGISF
jgi:hypothetical protein